MLPWTWTSFVIAMISACSCGRQADRIFRDRVLDVKMILIMLAGVNMVLFQSSRSGMWRSGIAIPFLHRPPPAGGLSMAFWLGVVICGRFIAFV